MIFGSMGDLTWRKLAPAVYNLLLSQDLPGKFAIIGLDKQEKRRGDFCDRFRDGATRYCDCGHVDEEDWQKIEPNIHFISGDFGDPVTYQTLKKKMETIVEAWGEPASQVFYLATPPGIMSMIVAGLGAAGLADDRENARIVVEKPFGHDLKSALDLNHKLRSVFEESQIYRIDHYLGKETVQNILAFRFANALFEPIWDRRYIDHVQITVAETVGVEHRGPYYEHAGALRDMIQNHLMQILCMMAMEPMVSFEADEIRNKKVDVLRAIRKIDPGMVSNLTVRGQYGSGQIDGKSVPAYREEPGVAGNSTAETYAAVKLFVDNWRWQDVPFFLRTGKRLKSRVSEVIIQFKPVPHQSFPVSAAMSWQPNFLRLHIQPMEGIDLSFQAKEPGASLHLAPVDLRFSYQDTFKKRSPEAYETLLADVMSGDATLFMRADQVECSWAVLMPILENWQNDPPEKFPNYAAGTWGPQAADALIAQNDRNWLQP